MEDEGIGISPGDHERIFERFVQGEAGDRRRFGGIGLGLYIVRRLARAQGADVQARSRPGGGTIMWLRLRRADGPGDQGAPPPEGELNPDQPPLTGVRSRRSPPAASR